MSFSNYLEEKLVKHSLGMEVYSPPTHVYLAVFTGLLNDTSDFTDEVTATGYTRFEVTGAFNYIGGGVENNTVIASDELTVDWGNVKAIAVCDAATGGNILYWGNFTVAKDVLAGDVFVFLTGNLKILLD